MGEFGKKFQSYKTLCFLDLEGTQFSHEMIAIGAIKVDLKKDLTIKKIHKGYYTLVKAKNKIGKVVTDLTGITEDDIKKNGVKFREAIMQLRKYMGRQFNGTLYITYGNHDARILSQSLAYNLDAPVEETRTIIKHSFDFAEWAFHFVKDEHGNSYSLSNLLKLFEIEFAGTKHNALDDTYNLALLYDAMIKRKDILSREYVKTLSNNKTFPEPIKQTLKQILNENKAVDKKGFEEIVKDSI